jgi:hypothetical protein
VDVYAEPRRGSAKRGLAGGPNSVFPVLSAVKAAGCASPWYQIAPDAFACSPLLRPGRGEPRAVAQPVLPPGKTMPASYLVTRQIVEVRSQPSPTAPRLHTLREDSGLLVRGSVKGDGGTWRRTRTGFVPAASVRFAQPSRLEGVPITAAEPLPVSWINAAGAFAFADETLRTRKERLPSYRRVTVKETRRVGRHDVARLGDDRWVLADRVRTARARPVPPEIKGNERWLHVSLADWTLVAYEGPRPVYAALISKGVKTPRGRYRITHKIAVATMNLGSTSIQYEAEAVPWVVYFKPRYALHAAYWHDGFGERLSHGCVNLSPRDARWVFDWVTPTLPPGWYQVHQAKSDPGTFLVIE